MPYGAAGIVELAEIDRKNEAALSDAQRLLGYASVPCFLFVVCVAIGLVLPIAMVSYAFIAFIGFVMFWWKFFAWSRKHFNSDYPDESFSMAVRLRRGSAVIATAGFLAVAFLFYTRVL